MERTARIMDEPVDQPFLNEYLFWVESMVTEITGQNVMTDLPTAVFVLTAFPEDITPDGEAVRVVYRSCEFIPDAAESDSVGDFLSAVGSAVADQGGFPGAAVLVATGSPIPEEGTEPSEQEKFLLLAGLSISGPSAMLTYRIVHDDRGVILLEKNEKTCYLNSEEDPGVLQNLFDAYSARAGEKADAAEN